MAYGLKAYSCDPLMANLQQKIIFRSGISLYTLFDKYLDYMLAKFEQHRMVRPI